MDNEMNKVVNPHDKLFREIWSDKTNVLSFLQHYLPADILGITELESLEICKDSFVEKDLKEYFSDMLYKVRFADSPGYVYILFEHKSYYEKLIHLQLLEYILKIWRMSLKEDNHAGLPVVIPLVLCHGRSHWPTDRTRLSSLIDGPIDLLAAYIPDFSFVLYDLTRFSDKDIKGTIMARVVMSMFKYIFTPDMEDKLPEIFSLMRKLMEKETGLQYLETVLRYLFSTVDIPVNKIKSIVDQSLSGKEENFIMTLAEKLRKQGFDKGIQQGLEQGLEQGLKKGMLQQSRESVIDILEMRFEIIPQSILMMINEINEPLILKSLLKKIVKVKSLDEFRHLIDLSMQ